MKIVYIFHDKENNTGGPAVHATRLLPRLVLRGHEVVALVGWLGSKEAHPNGDLVRGAGIECRFYDRSQPTETIASWILEQVRQLSPDVFIPNLCTHGCFAGRWVKAAGIPVICAHRSDDDRNRGRARFFGTGPLRWRVSGMVCVNEYLREELFRNVEDPIPSRVIPSGVEIPHRPASQD